MDLILKQISGKKFHIKIFQINKYTFLDSHVKNLILREKKSHRFAILNTPKAKKSHWPYLEEKKIVISEKKRILVVEKKRVIANFLILKCKLGILVSPLSFWRGFLI